MSKALEISSNTSVVVNTNRHKGTAMSRLLELADAYAMVVYQTKNPDSEEADAARTALLEAVEQLAGKSTAIDSQDLTIAYMAGRHDAQKSAVSEPCRHRIADARNALVQSGYVCVDCGAVFAAADHAAAVSEPVKIDYTVLYEFAEGNAISYNKLCTAVNMAIVTPPAEAKREPLTDDEKSIELYLEQALEYVQMVERNVTTDPRYMAHQAEQRIQSALNLVRLEGFKMAFGEIAKHADLVAKVKKAEAKREPLTFEEIESCYPEDAHVTDEGWITVSAQWLHDFARDIEAAHGIGAKE